MFFEIVLLSIIVLISVIVFVILAHSWTIILLFLGAIIIFSVIWTIYNNKKIKQAMNDQRLDNYWVEHELERPIIKANLAQAQKPDIFMRVSHTDKTGKKTDLLDVNININDNNE
ncbi:MULTISPECIES: hypothetical protein [unclassified Lonepinella]|uniref:hypothetical protein n=1 Tax=unclassified Lonepinella TaxID=2642006 RepID=UPI0036DF3D35